MRQRRNHLGLEERPTRPPNNAAAVIRADELGDLNKKFSHFVIQPDEKVCTGINRLNGIIQKLTQLGQPPTNASKLAKLKKALEIPSSMSS